MSEISIRDQLVGTWTLINFVVRNLVTGVEEQPWGEHPRGLILYTPDGYVSAQLQRSEQAPHSDPLAVSASEYVAGASSYVAYAGRFFVDDGQQSLSHEMAVSLFPDWRGQRQTRRVTLSGERLQLAIERPEGAPKLLILTWRRAEPNRQTV
jgi:hypothetical protein